MRRFLTATDVTTTHVTKLTTVSSLRSFGRPLMALLCSIRLAPAAPIFIADPRIPNLLSEDRNSGFASMCPRLDAISRLCAAETATTLAFHDADGWANAHPAQCRTNANV